MLKSEFDNLIKWNGKERPFYEVYYLKLNEPSLGVALWLRYTFLSPSFGDPTASVWAIFSSSRRPETNLALKETVTMSETVFYRSKFGVDIGGARLNNSSANGRLKNDKGSIAWNLVWNPTDMSFRHYPFFLYPLPWPPSKVVAPNLAVQAAGWFEVNGIRYDLSSMLHQGHVWGRRYSERWAWSDCIFFLEDKSAVMEIIAKPPLALGYLSAGGESFRFRTRGDFSLTGCSFEAKKGNALVRGRITADLGNLIGITYEGPVGDVRYCYNTNLADCAVEVFKKDRGKWLLFNKLTSAGTTSYETVQPIQVTGVPLSL